MKHQSSNRYNLIYSVYYFCVWIPNKTSIQHGNYNEPLCPWVANNWTVSVSRHGYQYNSKITTAWMQPHYFHIRKNTFPNNKPIGFFFLLTLFVSPPKRVFRRWDEQRRSSNSIHIPFSVSIMHAAYVPFMHCFSVSRVVCAIIIVLLFTYTIFIPSLWFIVKCSDSDALLLCYLYIIIPFSLRNICPPQFNFIVICFILHLYTKYTLTQSVGYRHDLQAIQTQQLSCIYPILFYLFLGPYERTSNIHYAPCAPMYKPNYDCCCHINWCGAPPSSVQQQWK